MIACIGEDAARRFKLLEKSVVRLVGQEQYQIYLQRIANKGHNMISLDNSSAVLFHHEGKSLCVDLVVGKAGTIKRLMQLLSAGKEMQFNVVRAETFKRSACRLYQKHGFRLISQDNNNYQLILEAFHAK